MTSYTDVSVNQAAGYTTFEVSGRAYTPWEVEDFNAVTIEIKVILDEVTEESKATAVDLLKEAYSNMLTKLGAE